MEKATAGNVYDIAQARLCHQLFCEALSARLIAALVCDVEKHEDTVAGKFWLPDSDSDSLIDSDTNKPAADVLNLSVRPSTATPTQHLGNSSSDSNPTATTNNNNYNNNNAIMVKLLTFHCIDDIVPHGRPNRAQLLVH